MCEGGTLVWWEEHWFGSRGPRAHPRRPRAGQLWANHLSPSQSGSFSERRACTTSSLVSALSPFPLKVVTGPEGLWTHRILTPWRSFQTDIFVKAVVLGLRNTRPFPSPVPPDQFDANLYLSPMHIRFLLSESRLYCHLVFKLIFPQSQVTDVDSLRNMPFPKSICYYGFWNIVLTNIQNFISTKVGSTFTMELSVKPTAQTACCLNTGLSGTLTRPWNTGGLKCRTHGRRIAWPEQPAS